MQFESFFSVPRAPLHAPAMRPHNTRTTRMYRVNCNSHANCRARNTHASCPDTMRSHARPREVPLVPKNFCLFAKTNFYFSKTKTADPPGQAAPQLNITINLMAGSAIRHEPTDPNLFAYTTPGK